MSLAVDSVTRLSFRTDSDYLPRLRPIARAVAKRAFSDDRRADDALERILRECGSAVDRLDKTHGSVANLTLRVTREGIDVEVSPGEDSRPGCAEVLSTLRNGAELQRLVSNRRETHMQMIR